MKNLKLISTIILTIMLVFSITTAVFADNETGTDGDNFWSDPGVIDNNATTLDGNGTELDNSAVENNAVVDDSNSYYENDLDYPYNDTENNSTTSNNTLAYTGIGDSNGIIALIVIISGIVAIYSAKKFNDYKNI